MASITNPAGAAIFGGIIAIALVLWFIVLIRRAGRKKDHRILEAFGKIPEPDRQTIENISAYHRYCASARPGGQSIDETTWNDLNMDDVYKRINVCASSVGEEYLFHMLHELEHEESALEKRERIIQWFAGHPQERLTVQKILLGIGKHKRNGLSYYIFNAAAEKIKHAWAFSVLAVLPVVGLLLMPFVLAPGAVITAVSIVTNIVIYYLYSLKLESEFESMRHFSSFLFGAKALQKKADRSMEACGVDLKSPLSPFRKTGGLIPGSARQTIAELEAFTIIFKAIFLVDLLLYNHIIHTMLRHTKELDALFKIVGETDAAISIASFRESLKHWCPPVFHDERSMVFQGMYHPLLREPVANSGAIRRNSIITGSNASGKSTFIKGLAVNNILAQTIHTCCAKQYGLKFAYVATSMALRDNIVSGDSYFVAEIKSLKRIVEFTQKQYCTCFIDEILRGTNTRERIAASTAVLKLLHETGSLCVVASHDIELTEILRGIYDNYHFSEKIIGKEIEFDYLLKNGPSQTTNAIKLLEYMGFDQRIVDEATAFLGTRGE